ncbi:MAG: cytochrome P450 [Acidimicrobiia bacterium]|nr:cytochrome P450 [Acidimicrobiia bacterium]
MSVGEPEAVIFNPLQAGYSDDPFPHLAEMRRLDPVHASPIGRWMLFRYDDVFRLLRDRDLSVDDRNIIHTDQARIAMFVDATDGNLAEVDSTSILGIDPPDHTRLRRLVSRAFTPRTIEGLRPRIHALVDQALDRMAERGRVDVVAELAFPLPFDVISEMMGMPEGDSDAVCAWSGALVKTLDPIIGEEEVRAAVDARRAMHAHIEEVIAWKRENPAEDLLSAMIAAEEDGDRMSTRELRDQVTLLFVAGHETTVNLIGTGIAVLLNRPDQAALLRDDPDLPTAIDELLRFISPVQFSRRVSLADVEFGGRTIPPGTLIMAGLASANRDEAKWGPTAAELDLTRDAAGRHLAFGSGIHYCLGASLAKLEGQITVASFLQRFPQATLVEARFNGRINLRGLDRLIVDLG